MLKKIIKKYLEKIPLRNVIILSSLNDFDGNAGALFNYMMEHNYDKKYVFVWSTIHNPKDITCRYAKHPRVKVYQEESRSFLKRYYFYVAKYMIWDNHPFTKRRDDQISIYLTHGAPPLKATQKIMPIGKNADYVLCPSKHVVDWEAREYNVEKEKIFICDQPRNDLLFKKSKGYLNDLKSKVKNYNKTVLWMPTFRKRQNGVKDSLANYFMGLPLVEDCDVLTEIDKYLQDVGVLLIIKIHPQQMLNDGDVNAYKNIVFMKDNILNGKRFDINEIMVETDAMLTDYSTVIWDYLLLDRPLGFVIPDIEQYSIGFAVDNPQDYMPGEKIVSISELKQFFENVINSKDSWGQERVRVCMNLHDFCDGNNCERILNRFEINNMEDIKT